ncbi:MAG: biotin--[acetyl-CoA-carboxylase] ligase [Bacteroidota bacterium]
MAALFTGKNFIELTEIDSTNVAAMELLATDVPEGTVIWAHHQTAGKGQRGNTWQSEKGKNLLFSLIYYPDFIPLREVFCLSKAMCLGVRAALAHFLPKELIQVKWPNDVRINHKKVAGILIENHLSAGKLSASITGIGLNVNQEVFHDEVASTATSMMLQSNAAFDREEVLQHILEEIEQRYLRLTATGSKAMDQEYYQHLYGFHEWVPVKKEGKEMLAKIIAIESSGDVLMEIEGKQRTFGLKEISFS